MFYFFIFTANIFSYKPYDGIEFRTPQLLPPLSEKIGDNSRHMFLLGQSLSVLGGLLRRLTCLPYIQWNSSRT